MGFKHLEQRARKAVSKKIVVVCAQDKNILEAVDRAAREKIATAVLVGDQQLIKEKADRANIDLSPHVIESEMDPVAAARYAMTLANEGSVNAIMKGKTTTGSLMQVLLADGIRRKGRLLSHLAGFEHPRLGKDRLVILTDAGLVTYPSLDQRVQIIKNAVEVARSFGTKEPNTAVLSLTEDVTEQIPVSLDASRLKKMNAPGGVLDGYGIVDGPMDLFCAVDAQIAKVKGVESEIAGKADILHCPDVVCGNMMSKGIIYFAQDARTGGTVVGGKVPIILLSRASSAQDKYCSLLLGISCAQ